MRRRFAFVAAAFLLVALLVPSILVQPAVACSQTVRYQDVFGPGDEQWGYPNVYTPLPGGKFLLGTLAPNGRLATINEYKPDGWYKSAQVISGFTGAIYQGAYPDLSKPLYLYSNSSGIVDVTYRAGTQLVPYKKWLAPSPLAVPQKLEMWTVKNDVRGQPKHLKF
jgi:hypothetical protein